jgi:hypothetical protein
MGGGLSKILIMMINRYHGWTEGQIVNVQNVRCKQEKSFYLHELQYR